MMRCDGLMCMCVCVCVKWAQVKGLSLSHALLVVSNVQTFWFNYEFGVIRQLAQHENPFQWNDRRFHLHSARKPKYARNEIVLSHKIACIIVIVRRAHVRWRAHQSSFIAALWFLIHFQFTFMVRKTETRRKITNLESKREREWTFRGHRMHFDEHRQSFYDITSHLLTCRFTSNKPTFHQLNKNNYRRRRSQRLSEIEIFIALHFIRVIALLGTIKRLNWSVKEKISDYRNLFDV